MEFNTGGNPHMRGNYAMDFSQCKKPTLTMHEGLVTNKGKIIGGMYLE